MKIREIAKWASPLPLFFGGLALVIGNWPGCAAEPAQMSDKQCETTYNALGDQHKLADMNALIKGPCSEAFERQMMKALQDKANHHERPGA